MDLILTILSIFLLGRLQTKIVKIKSKLAALLGLSFLAAIAVALRVVAILSIGPRIFMIDST